MTWRQALKAFNLTFVDGDTSNLKSQTSVAFDDPFTVGGTVSELLKFAKEYNLYIVPEAQDMTWTDGAGHATVTLSNERMDINITIANANDITGGEGIQTAEVNVYATGLDESVSYSTYARYDDELDAIVLGLASSFRNEDIVITTLTKQILNFSRKADRYSGVEYLGQESTWYLYKVTEKEATINFDSAE